MEGKGNSWGPWSVWLNTAGSIGGALFGMAAIVIALIALLN